MSPSPAMNTSSPWERKIFFGFTRLVGKSEKLQVDGRWRRRTLGRWGGGDMDRHDRLRNIDLGAKNISSRALVLGVFAGLQPVITQRRIQRTVGASSCFFAAPRARSHSGGTAVGRPPTGREIWLLRGNRGMKRTTTKISASTIRPMADNRLVPVFRSKLHQTLAFR